MNPRLFLFILTALMAGTAFSAVMAVTLTMRHPAPSIRIDGPGGKSIFSDPEIRQQWKVQ